MINFFKGLAIGKSKTHLSIFFVLLNIFLLSLIFFILVGAINNLKSANPAGKTIVVSGKGEVYAKPNLAVVDFSVETENKDISIALKENSQKMNKIIQAVKEWGIKESDLKTVNFSIYPRYEWHKTELFPSSGRRVLVGYDVSQRLRVKIRDLTKIGKIIKEAINNGANQVGGLNFTIENRDKFVEEARQKAVAEAKAKAKKIASLLRIKLKKIVSFNESNSNPLPIYRINSIDSSKSGVSPKLEEGENKIEVNIRITYQID